MIHCSSAQPSQLHPMGRPAEPASMQAVCGTSLQPTFCREVACQTLRVQTDLYQLALTLGMAAELSDGDAPAVVRANTEGPWGSSSQLNALRVSQDSQPGSPRGRASMSKRLRSVYSEMQVKVSSNLVALAHHCCIGLHV